MGVRRAFVDAMTAATFFVLLAVPSVAFLLGGGRSNADFIRNVEGRSVATMPPPGDLFPQTGAYTRGLERVIEDAFPLRRWLIGGYYITKFALLQDSPHETVLRGRDGWLFYAGIEAQYIDDQPPHSDADLDDLVRLFRKRQDWCAMHGTRFVLVFAPNKSTVYADELPYGFALARPTVLSRLLPRLRAAGVEAVDLLPSLTTARESGEVYSHGDTHWNDRGAFAAYQTIVRALAPRYADDLAHVAMKAVVHEGRGDLYAMAGVGDALKDRQIDYVFRQRARPLAVPPAIYDVAAGDISATSVDDRRLASVVLFGDSFSARLAAFFSEGFRRAVFAPPQFSERLVLAERPDIVVEEIVERNLADSRRWAH